MRNYFKTVGLASPSDVKIPHSSYLTYDNDPVHVLNGAGTIVTNPNRYYYWVGAYSDQTSTISCLSVIDFLQNSFSSNLKSTVKIDEATNQIES